MRVRHFVAALALACALGSACGNAKPTPTTIQLGDLDGRIQSALLTPDDLPAGWTTVTSPKRTNNVDVTGECGSTVLGRADAKFEVLYHGPSDGKLLQVPVVAETIYRFPAGSGKAYVDADIKCANAHDNGGTTQFTPLVISRLGDQTFGYRTGFPISDPSLAASTGIDRVVADTVYVRHGDVVIWIGSAGLGTRVDENSTKALADLADKKYSAATKQ